MDPSAASIYGEIALVISFLAMLSVIVVTLLRRDSGEQEKARFLPLEGEAPATGPERSNDTSFRSHG